MKMFFFLIVLLLAPPVRAEKSDDGFYTRMDVGGLYSTKAPLKKGINVQMGFGQKWGDIFRGEFTFEYTRTVMRGPQAYNGTIGRVRTHLPSWAAMATGYVDLFELKGVSPYIGAGVGVSKNNLPDAVADGRRVFGDSRFRPVWKITGGIGISLPKNLTLDIGYTYADLGRFATKSSLPPVLRQDVKIRKVNVGLRYNF